MNYKTRPILFLAANVRAILEDRKTQTRRVVKPAMVPMVEEVLRVNSHWTFEVLDGQIKSPYGYPGDHLWVRETFALERFDSEIGEPPFAADRPTLHYPGDGSEWDNEYWMRPHYRATDPVPGLAYGEENDPQCKWTPSIFMPRWASRIELEIIKIHAERLQDITNTDAMAEGVRESHFHQRADWRDLDRYHALWESINKKNGHGWDTNPLVWVLEFKRI